MGLPYQVLPLVAILDLIATTIFILHLGLLPTPQFLTINGTSSIASISAFISRLRGSTPRFASHTILIESTNPKKLLLIMLITCVFRSCIIMLISSSIQKGIQAGRVGSRSEDYSDRAIGYSVTCIISILLNLSILNLLFQSRGAPPNGSLKAIMSHMSASTLAAEQLIISAVEWILFLLVVGTNGLRSGAVSSSSSTNANFDAIQTPSTTEEQQQGYEINIEPTQEDLKERQVDERAPAPPIKEANPFTESKKKDYGALSQSQPIEESSVSKQAAPQENSPASTSTSNDDSERPSAISSDIVDVPLDRKSSMQGARDRLQRARENGKIRRRSIWKKIRGGKGDKGAQETIPTAQETS